MASERLAQGDATALVGYLDSLEAEAETFQAMTHLGEADVNARFLRGDQFPAVAPLRGDQYRFVMNVVNQTLKRHVALLTDSKPQINVLATRTNRRGTADTFKKVIAASWDEQKMEQLATRELVRAGTVGATVCVPLWDESADFGRGQITYMMYDPRQVKIDPTVVHAVDVQRLAEYVLIREVVPLNLVRERYPRRGWHVRPTARWSRYGSRRAMSTMPPRGVLSPIQRPWRRYEDEAVESEVPRVELRHAWFRDWPRDADGAPMRGQPRHIRYVADAEGVVLKDERLVYLHGQMPAHMLDWDIEFEHPYGIPMVSALRRMQYTLNRIVGQVMENVIMTNRVKVVADAGAVDPKTWDAITQNLNGIYIKKRQGHTLTYELPANVVPAYVMTVVEMLLRGMDMVTGLADPLMGRPPKNLSGVAIDALQTQAQSVVRLQARVFESWLERIFQQVLALIYQYYTTDRLLHVVGPGMDLVEFEFTRQALLTDDAGHPYSEDDLTTLWQDFQFKIVPGSSLAMTRLQKGVMALNLYQAGLLPAVEVLKAAEWPNPEETWAEAQKQLQAGMGPGQRTSRKMMRLPNVTRRQAISV